MRPIAGQDMAALCSRLAGQDDFVLFDTARVTDSERRTLLFTDPVRWLICDAPGQEKEFLAEVERLEHQGSHLAGWFAYEFGYLLEPSLHHLAEGCKGPLAVMGEFRQPLVHNHGSGDFASFLAQIPGQETEPARGDCGIHDIRTSMSEADYLAAIDRIQEYIVAGDTYQVNYTLKLKFSFSGEPGTLYLSLRRNQAVSFGAWIRQGGRDIMSFSPELFFRSGPEGVTVRPMKGTMSRGRTLAEDMQQRERLQADLKNRSENVMIVDLLRNDLGRLLHSTGGGEVVPCSLFDVEVYDTLLQMTSTVQGIPAGAVSPGLVQTLSALYPCGSVTGAPKIRTMEIIHELERETRGVYCGAIGYSIPGSKVFNVPIRTVVMEGENGEMGIGSGIVSDSDPRGEWQESLLKARFLTCSRPDFNLIETLLWQPGKGYWLLDEHMDRLRDSAAYFLFAFSEADVRDALAVEALPFTGPMRVRLLLGRDGIWQISSSPQADEFSADPTRPVETTPLPRVIFSATRTDPDNIHLYHKTTERDLYLSEREAALKAGMYEVLFTNQCGEVTEGSITNIFVRSGDILLTPSVTSGLLAGTFRRYLLAKGIAREEAILPDDVAAADAVYVGNSVRGLVRVEVQAG